MGHSIALYAVQFAHALGASRVDFLDADPVRLELARSFGANPLEGPASGSAIGEYQITVDASADPAGLASALRSVAPGGVCTSVGIYYMETTPVPLLEMFARGVRFYTGRVNARRDIPPILDLVQAGRIHPEQITSEIVEWDDAAKALANPSMKPVIVREPELQQ